MAKKKNKSRKSKKKKTKYIEVAHRESDIMAGLRSILPDSTSGQLLVGVLIGGALTYLLSDEEVRKKIIRQGVLAFGNMAGAMAELQEQIADVQAEVEAERATEA
ncbi:MAG: YtxH domain-containing protein [Pseudomonadota bacterium]